MDIVKELHTVIASLDKTSSAKLRGVVSEDNVFVVGQFDTTDTVSFGGIEHKGFNELTLVKYIADVKQAGMMVEHQLNMWKLRPHTSGTIISPATHGIMIAVGFTTSDIGYKAPEIIKGIFTNAKIDTVIWDGKVI